MNCNIKSCDMKSSKKLQISSHLLFVYINNQDRKWHTSVLVFSSALVYLHCLLVAYVVWLSRMSSCSSGSLHGLFRCLNCFDYVTGNLDSLPTCLGCSFTCLEILNVHTPCLVQCTIRLQAALMHQKTNLC